MTKVGRILLAAVPVAFAAWVYYPITANFFHADDFPNLFLIQDSPLLPYLLKPHGGHILLARNFVFFLNMKLGGPVPSHFFWPVLITHLFNTWLLFRVLERFSGSAFAACLGATLWAVSPAHEETLGWYSVYGHVLVGTILLVVLHRAAAIARGRAALSWRVCGLWFVLALVAATCFGTGIGVAMALPLVAIVSTPGFRRHRSRFVFLLALLVVVPLLYVGLLNAYVHLSGNSYPASMIFGSVADRVGRTTAMLAYLLGWAASRFPLGFVAVPNKFPDPLSLSIAAVFAAGVLWLVWQSPPSRRTVLTCLVLLPAVYGTIAAGRAQYFGNDVAARFLIAQGRYHYVGYMLLALLLSLVLAQVGARLRPSAPLSVAALATWLVLMAVAHLRLGAPIDRHDSTRAEVESVFAAIRRKAGETPPGEPVYVTNRYFESVPVYLIKFVDFPGWAGVFVVFQPGNTLDGRRIYFVQRPRWMMEKLKHGKRMAELIVPPGPGIKVDEKVPNPFVDVVREALGRKPKREKAGEPKAK